jgi:hypothetical protein
MNQLDKLFKNKLEGFQKPAPSTAWDRVQSGLDKKNNKFFWLKIAASILVLAIAFALIFFSQKPEFITKENKQQNDPVNPKQNVTDKILPEQKTADATDKSERRQPVLENSKEKKTDKKSPASKKKTDDKTQQKQTDKQLPPVDVTNVPDHAVAELNTTVDNVLPETDQKETSRTNDATVSLEEKKTLSGSGSGVTLIYTADEVDEKYLDKKSLAEATRDDKKPSTFKKLLDKAYDLKHNQDPIGDLRQKKNEILALNFKSDKQRSQNR